MFDVRSQVERSMATLSFCPCLMWDHRLKGAIGYTQLLSMFDVIYREIIDFREQFFVWFFSKMGIFGWHAPINSSIKKGKLLCWYFFTKICFRWSTISAKISSQDSIWFHSSCNLATIHDERLRKVFPWLFFLSR